MFTRKLTMSITAGAAAIAVAVGAFAIGNSSSTNTASGAATGTPPAQSRQAPRGGSQGPTIGQVPRNWRPGTGTIITGAAADKAKAAAVAKYPQGTVNRVLKLSDGSYAVHRIGPGTNGQHHIFVSPDFKVTGTS
ncbi:MAG: hypothetical protein QOE65_2006 [Solirubrobacteraceae bacterium]|nr:hypothetical protein [Solirubrobacteraceae bacterium]